MMYMRATINLDEELLAGARRRSRRRFCFVADAYFPPRISPIGFFSVISR